MDRDGSTKKGVKRYAVGYCKPPRHTRFQKGVSGNPRGKKKGHKGLKAIVEGALWEKVSIRTARGIRRVPKLDALVQKLMNDALTGDPRAVVQVVRLAKEAGLTQEAGVIEAAAQELSEEDNLILARYMKAPRPS